MIDTEQSENFLNDKMYYSIDTNTSIILAMKYVDINISTNAHIPIYRHIHTPTDTHTHTYTCII